MSTEENKTNTGKKRKLRWLAYTGLSLLVISLGIAPLLLLFTYTRAEVPWDSWFGRTSEAEQRDIDNPPEPPTYTVQYIYRYCDHVLLHESEAIPPHLPAPPQQLAEIALAMVKSNLSINGLAAELNIPPDWHLSGLGEGKQPSFILTHMADLCPECQGRYFLGIFNEHIAVFEGGPPEGKLIEITEYPVKETDRDVLEKGVPFATEEERELFMETFTS